MNKTYLRNVHYYETDRMSIVHHSNYIRWMEEARLDYMTRLGVDYPSIEREGILMPVVSVGCSYKFSAQYGDTAEIAVQLTGFNGVRCTFSYQIFLAGTDKLLAVGESAHCFLDEKTRKPVNLKKRLPEESKLMLEILAADAE